MSPKYTITTPARRPMDAGRMSRWRKGLPVLLYLKYIPVPVSKPMMMATNTWMRLYEYAASSPTAMGVNNCLLVNSEASLLKTGMEVMAMISRAERKRTTEPTNIQNSREEASSSLAMKGMFL